MEELHSFPSFGVGVGAQRHNITQIGRAVKVPVLNSSADSADNPDKQCHYSNVL